MVLNLSFGRVRNREDAADPVAVNWGKVCPAIHGNRFVHSYCTYITESLLLMLSTLKPLVFDLSSTREKGRKQKFRILVSQIYMAKKLSELLHLKICCQIAGRLWVAQIQFLFI